MGNEDELFVVIIDKIEGEDRSKVFSLGEFNDAVLALVWNVLDIDESLEVDLLDMVLNQDVELLENVLFEFV